MRHVEIRRERGRDGCEVCRGDEREHVLHHRLRQRRALLEAEAFEAGVAVVDGVQVGLSDGHDLVAVDSDGHDALGEGLKFDRQKLPHNLRSNL